MLIAAPKGTVAEKGGKLTLDKEAFLASGKIDGALSIMEQAGMSVNDGEDLMFTVEGWGQLPPKVMIDKAAEILIENLDDFGKSL